MKRLSSNLYLDTVSGKEMLYCRCGAVLGPGDAERKSLLLIKHADLSKAGPHINPYRLGTERFFLTEYCCPACLRLIDTEVAVKEA
jgi:Acetone carboxylase gamma subunit